MLFGAEKYLSRTASISFLGNLNDFLPRNQRGRAISISFNCGQTIKHLIESLGVPHVEVGRILAAGRPVDFSYQVEDGDFVEVHPLEREPANLAEPRRFILDNHLGQLAIYLRMLGFDALYRNDFQDKELANLASQGRRTLLTRDRRLLMRNQFSQGYWVRNTLPRQQLVEIVQRFDLSSQIAPFRRCMRCNGLLQPVEKATVLDRLEPLTRLYFEDFRICPDCGRIYWKGSHYERMQHFIDQVLQSAQVSHV